MLLKKTSSSVLWGYVSPSWLLESSKHQLPSRFVVGRASCPSMLRGRRAAHEDRCLGFRVLKFTASDLSPSTLSVYEKSGWAFEMWVKYGTLWVPVLQEIVCYVHLDVLRFHRRRSNLMVMLCMWFTPVHSFGHPLRVSTGGTKMSARA